MSYMAIRNLLSEFTKYHFYQRECRPISDSEVTKLLRRLVDNGFVMKVNNQYVIADPILRRISDRVRCR